MYPVLFNEKISSYLAHGEGKECVKCCETHFYKNTEKTLVCDKLRCALNKKQSKIVRRQESVGENTWKHSLHPNPPKVSKKCKEEPFSSCKKHIFILQNFIDRNKPMDCNLCYVFRRRKEVRARDDMINEPETSHFPSHQRLLLT